MIFANRTRRGRDRYLPWKIVALVVGALLLLLGARLNNRWMIWTAIALLLVGYLLRFLPQSAPNKRAEDES